MGKDKSAWPAKMPDYSRATYLWNISDTHAKNSHLKILLFAFQQG
jgi:hypothetical protein